MQTRTRERKRTAPANASLSAATRLVALLGQPVAQSISPRLQNAAFRHLGLNLAYVASSVKPEELAAAVQGLRALGFVGANVTIPHKEAVLPLLDRLTDAARLIGSANTLYWEEGQLVGENTDGPGLVAALRDQGMELAGRHVTILGSGGTAKAVAAVAAQEGARAVVMTHRHDPAFYPRMRFDRLEDWKEWRHSNAADAGGGEANFFTRMLTVPPQLPFAISLCPVAGEHLTEELRRTDFLVNATPLGMWPLVEAAPLTGEQLALLPATAVVVDLVYNPAQTRLLRMARRRRLKGVNGLGMLLHQGALAFRLWTGQEAPLEVMRRALKAPKPE